jgi:hypothetical protein
MPRRKRSLLAQDVQTLLQQFRRGERGHRALILRCDIAFMTLSALPARAMSNMHFSPKQAFQRQPNCSMISILGIVCRLTNGTGLNFTAAMMQSGHTSA